MTTFADRRTVMVDTQVRPSDVTKFPIIDAMLSVRREAYVPGHSREAAYMGENLDLGSGRILLEPRSFAKLLDALDVQPSELVLDVGAALGYSAAVLGRLGQAVIALEADESMASDAVVTLLDEGVDNVIVEVGSLAGGAPEHAPFDVIVIEGAVEEIPQSLVDQLADGGRMGAIFAEGALGVARIGYKIDGAMSWRFSFNASAPVLAGFERAEEFEL